MQYPHNDLWSVRQIEFLRDALEGYEHQTALYYPSKTVTLDIPAITTYTYRGVLHFPGKDRTILFEQGDGYGLQREQILEYLTQKDISVQELP